MQQEEKEVQDKRAQQCRPVPNVFASKSIFFEILTNPAPVLDRILVLYFPGNSHESGIPVSGLHNIAWVHECANRTRFQRKGWLMSIERQQI